MRKSFWGKENRGITLVELLVTVALLAIVGGAITAFMSFTQRSYAKSVTKTSLQSESQLVANQIQELLIDAVDVAEITAGTEYEVTYESKDSISLIYDDEADKITYRENASGDSADLAEEVEGFSLDLDRVEDERTVTMYLRLTKGDGTSFAASHKIYLRNSILSGTSTNEDWKDEVTPTVTNVTVKISPESLYVWPGSTYALSALVSVEKADGTKIQPLSYQDVIWECTNTFDDTAKKTKVNNSTNVLEVDLEEIRDADGEFNIIAYKNIDGTRKASEQTLTAKVRRIDDISFTDSLANSGISSVNEGTPNEGKYSGDTYEVTPGSEIWIQPVIEGQNIDDLDLTDLGGLDLVIDDDKNNYVSDYTFNRSNGKIVIKTNKNASIPDDVDATFTVTIKCRQYGFTRKKLELTYKLRSQVTINLVEVGGNTVTSGMKRNGIIHLKFDPDTIDGIEELQASASDTARGIIEVKTTYLLNGNSVGGSETYENTMYDAKQVSTADNYKYNYLKFNSATPMVFGFVKNSTDYDFYLKLREDTIAYGKTMSDNGVSDKHKFDQVRLDVTYYSSDKTSTYGKGSYTINVEDASLEFSVMSPTKDTLENTRWKAAENKLLGNTSSYAGEDIEYIYVTNNDKEVDTRTLYYMMPTGYTPSDVFGFDQYNSSNKYIFRFQPAINYNSGDDWKNQLVGVGSDGKTYSNLNVTDSEAGILVGASVGSSKSNYTIHKLTFKTSDLKDAVNSNFGSWTNAAAANNGKGAYIDECFGYSADYSGLTGRVRFVIKNTNVFINYHTNVANQVKSWYCPTYDELNEQANVQYDKNATSDRYCYVSEGLRYRVYKKDDVNYADYQIRATQTSDWGDPLITLTYDEAGESGAGWYDTKPTDNIHYVTAKNLYYSKQLSNGNKYYNQYIPESQECASFADATEEPIPGRDYDYVTIAGRQYDASDVKVISLGKDYGNDARYFVITNEIMYYAWARDIHFKPKQVKINKRWVYKNYWEFPSGDDFTTTYYWKQDTIEEYGWYDVNTTNIDTKNVKNNGGLLPQYAYIDISNSMWNWNWNRWHNYSDAYWNFVYDPLTLGVDKVSRYNDTYYEYLKVNDQDLYLVPHYVGRDEDDNYYYVAYYRDNRFQYWLKRDNSTYKFYSADINAR